MNSDPIRTVKALYMELCQTLPYVLHLAEFYLFLFPIVNWYCEYHSFSVSSMTPSRLSNLKVIWNGKYCSQEVLRTEFSDLEVWSSLGTKIKPKHWSYLRPIFYRCFISNKSINPTDSVLKSYPETNLIFNFSHSFLRSSLYYLDY